MEIHVPSLQKHKEARYSPCCPLREKVRVLFPAFQFVLQFRQLAAMEHGLFDALPLLLPVIVEQAEGVAAQQQDGRQVTGGEESHEEVDDVPYQLKAGQGSEDDHYTC